MTPIDTYLGRRTLFVGDVNSGKTLRTRRILEAFLCAGHGPHTALLDLAPEAVGRVGGKLAPPAGSPVRYLTTEIVAPRLTGVSPLQVRSLAQANAVRIEALFEQLHRRPARILFVNDASLYLQAGAFDRFAALLAIHPTAVINAYYGRSFADSALTRRERRLTRQLMDICEPVVTVG